jgi:hypothetical protein
MCFIIIFTIFTIFAWSELLFFASGTQRLSSISALRRPKTAVVYGFESSKGWSVTVKSPAVGVADDDNDEEEGEEDDGGDARRLLLALGSMSLKCTWRKLNSALQSPILHGQNPCVSHSNRASGTRKYHRAFRKLDSMAPCCVRLPPRAAVSIAVLLLLKRNLSSPLASTH